MLHALSMVSPSGLTYAQQVIADGATQFFRMNEASGTVGVDQINSSDNGTYYSCTLGQAGIPGDVGGGSVAFNGSLSYLRYPNTTITGTSFTLEIWAYKTTTAMNPQSEFITLGGTGTGQAVGLECEYSSDFLGSNLVGTPGPRSTVAIPFNVWSHLAVVYTAGSAQLYVNGVANGSPVSTSPAISGNAYNCIGAAYTVGDYFAGNLCNAAVYNTALTQAQLLNHYNIGIA